MYRVQLGNFTIQDGDVIGFDENMSSLNNEVNIGMDYFNILWDSTPNELYTLLIVDEGEVTPNPIKQKEKLHLLIINISQDSKFPNTEYIVDFIPITGKNYQRPHRFRIDLFWQSAIINTPPISLINAFDLNAFLNYYRQQNQTLLLEDSLHFQIKPNQIQYMPSPPRRKKQYPTFNEMYNLDTLTEEDIRLIADTYCIKDSQNRPMKEILKRIEYVLNKAKK
jgi:hypothetical protein